MGCQVWIQIYKFPTLSTVYHLFSKVWSDESLLFQKNFCNLPDFIIRKRTRTQDPWLVPVNGLCRICLNLLGSTTLPRLLNHFYMVFHREHTPSRMRNSYSFPMTINSHNPMQPTNWNSVGTLLVCILHFGPTSKNRYLAIGSVGYCNGR